LDLCAHRSHGLTEDDTQPPPDPSRSDNGPRDPGERLVFIKIRGRDNPAVPSPERVLGQERIEQRSTALVLDEPADVVGAKFRSYAIDAGPE